MRGCILSDFRELSFYGPSEPRSSSLLNISFYSQNDYLHLIEYRICKFVNLQIRLKCIANIIGKVKLLFSFKVIFK